MTVVRFGLEVLQMVQFKQWYLLDWTNWIELALFAFTIMFIFVFPTPCLCPQNWQWELGILAVFLAWINLVLFVQKFPVIGIYIVMFLKICKTFLWTVLLSLLLIVSFGLAFYMAFYEPKLQVSVTIACPQNKAYTDLKIIHYVNSTLYLSLSPYNYTQTTELYFADFCCYDNHNCCISMYMGFIEHKAISITAHPIHSH